MGGTFTFKGKVVGYFGGNVFTSGDDGAGGTGGGGTGGWGNGTSSSGPTGSVPPPGQNRSSETWYQAGGSTPGSYNWGPDITSNATDALYLLEFLDNILLEILFDGFQRLNGGDWNHLYPKSIVDTIGAMSAQALVHRSTSTDTLLHFKKPLNSMCQYTIPNENIDSFLHATLSVLLLEIGVLIDVSATLAATEPWLVPVLTSEVGAKARMIAVVNMMKGHLAAAAVREAVLPGALAWSYAQSNYIQSCPETIANMPKTPFPPLKVTRTETSTDKKRVISVIVQLDAGSNTGSLFIAWIGPWGSHGYTSVNAQGVAEVPELMYGDVWLVLTNKEGMPLHGIADQTVAGPYLLWVGQP